MVKLALNASLSKQGNARLAADSSNCVMAKNLLSLSEPNLSRYVEHKN